MLSSLQVVASYQFDQLRRHVVSAPVVMEEDDSNSNKKKKGVISTIYIAKEGTAPMESIETATLIAGVGIEGDRYASNIRKGTYSGKFLEEPGRHLTLISWDAIQEKLQSLPKETHHTFTMDKLRRNVIVKGLSAQDLNDMVGRQIFVAGCRLFVHRRNVPCKYRQAETKCPNFMNNFWGDCGLCCEILEGGTIKIGDLVEEIPHTYQPARCDVGLKPPGFFTKPAARSLEEVKAAIIPVPIAIGLALWDPQGFERVELGYRSKGQYFWSPQAYKAGMFVIAYVRTPLLLALGVGVVSTAIAWSNGL